jgi:hypothetical protein
MGDKIDRAYVLVIIEPGKDEAFANAIVSTGLLARAVVERMDFLHGSFDFIIILKGTRENIDSVILEMRKLPFVKRTQTLIPFDMFTWDDMSAALKKSP